MGKTLVRNLVAAGLVLVMIGPGLAADPAESPAPLAPRQVVAAQLDALRHNDQPGKDAGLRVAWAFAHPLNKLFTGPFPHFARIMKTPHYRPLINHRSHEITLYEATDVRTTFAVVVTDEKGDVLGYQWVVERVSDGPEKGAWRTTTVSPPVDLGNAI